MGERLEWTSALTHGDHENVVSTTSIHLIITRTKHQRIQMRREVDRGRRGRLAEVAASERSQIEYHPACQDGCQELLKSTSAKARRFVMEEGHSHG